RAGGITTRRVWKCAVCRQQYSVLVGTVFENSKVPVSKWILAIKLTHPTQPPITASALGQAVGVSTPTAHAMIRRLETGRASGLLAALDNLVLPKQSHRIRRL